MSKETESELEDKDEELRNDDEEPEDIAGELKGDPNEV